MLAISIRNQPKMPAIPVYGICNQPVLISGCVTGKIFVLFMISVIFTFRKLKLPYEVLKFSTPKKTSTASSNKWR